MSRYVRHRTSNVQRLAMLASIVLRATLGVLCLTSALRAQDRAVRMGVTISKDTVTIGEPFEIRIRIRAPADAQIHFPDNPDSSGTIQGRDPHAIATSDTVQFRDQTATYHVAAWDIGAQRVIFAPVTVTWAPKGEREVPVTAAGVFVRSVLPADSALRVPKPAR